MAWMSDEAYDYYEDCKEKSLLLEVQETVEVIQAVEAV